MVDEKKVAPLPYELRRSWLPPPPPPPSKIGEGSCPYKGREGGYFEYCDWRAGFPGTQEEVLESESSAKGEAKYVPSAAVLENKEEGGSEKKLVEQARVLISKERSKGKV